MNDNNTPDGQVDASQLNAATPDGTVTSGSKDVTTPTPKMPEAMTLEELNNTLGKSFKNKESALKSLKDTFSYVGKKIEDVRNEVVSEVKTNEATEKLAKEVAELKKEMFYKDHPDYANPAIRNFIEKIGGNPSEVVNSKEFKEIFDKVSGFDKSTQLRTVLDSNPRLMAVKDNLTKAKEILSKNQGMVQGNDKTTLEKYVVDGVKAAFEI